LPKTTAIPGSFSILRDNQNFGIIFFELSASRS
jgi:hypothetical protein